jgi:hypothetical protein
MSQTLLALLAMVLATFVSFNQKRNAVNTYEAMIQNEIEMAVSGSMMNAIELIGGRSFDEGASPEKIKNRNRLPSGVSEFNVPSQFGATDRGSLGCNIESPYLTPDCDDIDDVDGIRDATVTAYLTNGRMIPFLMDVEVDYVTDGVIQNVSSVPTRHKRVTLVAENPLLPGGRVVLERVFSYDPVKTEMNYETVFGPLGIDL